MEEGIAWTLLAALAALLLAAAVCDLKRREIPHWVVIGIAVLAPPFWWANGLDLWPDVVSQVGVAALIFAVFAAAFAFGWMGGGDVKLLTALGPLAAVAGGDPDARHHVVRRRCFDHRNGGVEPHSTSGEQT
jgi:Flp pilus assembly protein protease CpaA